MSREAPYTVTVYVAAPGTPLRAGGTSAAGHMYLVVEHGKERVSASLNVLAKENGLSRVDHVMLSERTPNATAAENIFVVQGERNDPAHLRASMPTAQAAQTPVEASLERGEQLANANQQTQQLAAQAEQTQSQEREAALRRMG